jgi:multidrug efflux pump subunit AcrB
MSFMAGGSGSNLGSMFVILKPWKDRKGKEHSVDAVIDKTYGLTADIQEAVIFSVNPPAIPGLGMSSGLQMQLLDINNLGPKELKQAVEDMQAAVAKTPEIKEITSMYEGEVPQYAVKIDRDKVKLQGLVLEDVYSALSSYMGGSYVNEFVEFGRVYQVNLSAEGRSRAVADDVLDLSVRNSSGQMVPFASFATVEPSLGQGTVSRYNMYTTASVTATVADGVSSSDGIKAMERMMDDVAGDSFSYAWTGEAYQETGSGVTITMVLLFAVLITILVLAAQYESWTDPVAVVITTPTAVLGTIVGCIFMSQSISIYTQIGIILLIGMAAKNAILIVEYAMDYRKAGLPVRKAAQEAGSVRLRPILMTALAFVFGVMPMLFASGAGAASRVSLGTAVVFGMAVNALIGTFFVPNFWELLQNFQEKYLSRIFSKSDVSTAKRTDDNIEI